LNVFCFAPLGLLAARTWRAKPFHAALLVSLLTSMTMETGQIVIAERIPSLLDIVLNVSGGALGAFASTRTRSIDHA
jgi:glycopeptide antibiotics resistance protein